jgi:hypothetical protein
MKAFIAGLVAAAGIAVLAYLVLGGLQENSAQRFAAQGSTRVDAGQMPDPTGRLRPSSSTH